MPINTLEFAQKFTGELDKLFVQGPVTGFFADNVLRSAGFAIKRSVSSSGSNGHNS